MVFYEYLDLSGTVLGLGVISNDPGATHYHYRMRQ